MTRNMTVTWTLRIIVCHLLFRISFGELVLLQTVFRHGNRMPTKEAYYPKDPYINDSYAPPGPGGLTNVGKMAEYKLGQYFRERYDGFLGTVYTENDIWFRADNVERVVMSAELVAAGLYPPTTIQRWNPHLNWQPIPVWTFPPEIDYLYNGYACETYPILRAEVERIDMRVKNYERRNRDIYKYLSVHTGGNITQARTFGLRQVLYAQRDVGLKLPEWTKLVFPYGKLDELAINDMRIRTGSLPLKQLLGGIWIREWLDHVDRHLNKSDTRKAFMYGAHELTLAAILTTLDNFDNRIPTYSSTLMFELHKEDNEYYVQIFYRDEGLTRILEFPGCENNNTLCPLDVFRELVAPVLPKDIIAMCKKIIETASV